MPAIYVDKDSLNQMDDKKIINIINENTHDQKYEHLHNYYVGNQKILNRSKNDRLAPNNRLVNNMAKYITDTSVGYFIGKPVVYSCDNSFYLEMLQDIFNYNDEQDHNSELAKTCSIFGNAFEMIYIDERGKIRLALIKPSDLIMIYESGSSTPIAAIRLIQSMDISQNKILNVEYWDSEKVIYLKSVNNKDLEVINEDLHYYGDIPFIEYLNNDERMGDYEGVIDLIDAYNLVQSNSANYYQYNDEALLKICKIGDVTSKDITEMKEKGAVILEDGGEIDWLLKNFDDTALENYKNRLVSDIHTLSNVPNMADETFGNNLSGVAVSYKLWGLEQICVIKERKFKKGLQRRIEILTHLLKIQHADDIFTSVNIEFRRNKPQNILEISQVVTMLSTEVSQETRLKLLPIIDNVKEEILRLEKEKINDLNNFGNNYDNLGDFVKAFDKNNLGEEEKL